MKYTFIFFLTVSISLGLSFLIKMIALKLNILDKPNLERKIHKKATPLLGGLAIFISFFLILFLFKQDLIIGDLEYRHWLGFGLGALFLMIGGVLDDKYGLKPEYQIIWPILAILCLIWGGVAIEKVSNPFGGFIYLDRYFLSSGLIAIWLLIMMYTTKLLDGVDGLVSGIGAIGGIIIFLFTITTKYYQPDIALASLVFAGACAGFLILNWHPAKIFLGEGGSLLIGFVLGVLAIISGGKIAIALLVLGIPILDVLWTVIRRILNGKNPFRFADKKHLHHRLLGLGLGHRKTVLVFYAFAGFFGLAGLFLQSIGKALAISALVIIMLVLVISFSAIDKKKS